MTWGDLTTRNSVGERAADHLAARWDAMHGQEEETVDGKTCRGCGEEKPLDDFYKGQGKCKPCYNAAQRARKSKGGSKPDIRAARPAPEKSSPAQIAEVRQAAVDEAWREVFANPTLVQLEALQAFLEVASLDEAARISRTIAGA